MFAGDRVRHHAEAVPEAADEGVVRIGCFGWWLPDHGLEDYRVHRNDPGGCSRSRLDHDALQPLRGVVGLATATDSWAV